MFSASQNSQMSYNSNNDNDEEEKDEMEKGFKSTDHQLRQSNIQKMNILYKKDRHFALGFLKNYFQQHPDEFDIYDCSFDLTCKSIRFPKKVVRHWIIQIHSIGLREENEEGGQINYNSQDMINESKIN